LVEALSDTPIANPIQITNIRCNLAVEVNSAIANQVRQKVMTQGLTQLVPYVYQNVYASSAGSEQASQQFRMNAGHGHSLLNLYTSTANGKTSSIGYTDIDNTDSKKVTSYQASVDNQNTTEFRPDCKKSEDYMVQRHMLEGSVVGQSANVFKFNRALVHSWRAGKCKDWTKTDEVLDGLSLDAERIFTIEKDLVTEDGEQNPANTNGLRHIIWAVIQRRLTIAPNGDVVMN
jgi:hypothetical protein